MKCFVFTLLVASACRPDTTTGVKDLSMPANEDMATKNYMATTSHDIDTNKVIKGTAVSLSGAVVMTPVDQFYSGSLNKCIYEVWVSDANCTTPPCGLVVEVNGDTPPQPNSASCPFVENTNNALKAFKI